MMMADAIGEYDARMTSSSTPNRNAMGHAMRYAMIQKVVIFQSIVCFNIFSLCFPAAQISSDGFFKCNRKIAAALELTVQFKHDESVPNCKQAS